jgi:hypothetical protein
METPSYIRLFALLGAARSPHRRIPSIPAQTAARHIGMVGRSSKRVARTFHARRFGGFLKTSENNEAAMFSYFFSLN